MLTLLGAVGLAAPADVAVEAIEGAFSQDFPVALQVRSYGSLPDWFDASAFTVGLLTGLKGQGHLARSGSSLFDGPYAQSSWSVVYELGFNGVVLVEIHPAGERVDLSIQGFRVGQQVEAVPMTVLSIEPAAAPRRQPDARARVAPGESARVRVQSVSCQDPPDVWVVGADRASRWLSDRWSYVGSGTYDLSWDFGGGGMGTSRLAVEAASYLVVTCDCRTASCR